MNATDFESMEYVAQHIIFTSYSHVPGPALIRRAEVTLESARYIGKKKLPLST